IQVLWQYKGDRVQPVAANGGIGNLKRLVGEEFESFFRNKVLERVDPVIDFNWRGNPPGKGLDKDNFSARWKGRLIVPKDGEYIFYTVSTDGARLHIDAELLIDNWRDSRTASTKTVIRNLKAGSHDILVEYYERDGNAEMKLEWEGPDIERQAIPKEALRATAADDAPVGLTGTYFNFGMAWLENAFPQRKENEFIFTWTDLNDNGFVDGDEVRFGKPGKDDKFVTSCGVGWNWLMNANFLTATGASGPGLTGLIYFRPKAERSKHGYPIFDLPKEVVPQAGGQGMMVDLKGNVICLTGPVKSVSPEGKINWRYINEWPGLHAGHGTTARGDEPGVLIAPCRFFGSAWINDEIGEVIVFNSNLGCTYLMTADDGLFIERGFRDTRVGLLWRMPQPPTPEVMTETSLSDEHFGGTFQKCKDADGKEHLYYVAGKPHSSVVELLGLEKGKRLPGGKFEVTAEDIAAAALRRQQQMARQAPPKVYAVHRSRPDEVKIDGRADEWPKERMDDGRQGSFALACDDANLYVLFTGRDDRAVFKNGATNFPDVFKHGDVVDVKLKTRAGLKPNRSKAGRGDIRLSFAMFEGKPVCILYDFDVEGIDKGMPFSSPWRTEWINKVVLIPEASISVNRERNTYVLEASVPLKLIHLDPTALGQTRGDVGRVLSDQTGSAAAARVYWANKNTHIVSDLPSEAALQPSLWGMFVFEKE
ncbi:MAG: hypothetical protein HQ592_16700, partial [Planctomycetes bacterium]|nr:hypothetical protein [Planctomycetota bacterium]